MSKNLISTQNIVNDQVATNSLLTRISEDLKNFRAKQQQTKFEESMCTGVSHLTLLTDKPIPEEDYTAAFYRQSIENCA
ncbi:MAG: hypothetical protein JWL92_402 [Candidatus Nomurabacteria bacterium]|nr:hypothetical protein [Candidatus Nomurabacteria bacterium]